MTDMNKTEVIAIIDKSGSMWPAVHDTICGFNGFIDTQRRAEGSCFISLYQFSTGPVLRCYEGVNVINVRQLTSEDYAPGGGTALLDAVGTAINETGFRLAQLPEDERPGQVIFLIITDGCENSSVEFKVSQVREMVTHQTEKYNWRFVFMGSGDIMMQQKQAQSLGMLGNNTYNFGNNSTGTERAYSSAAAGIVRTRQLLASGDAVLSTRSLLTDEEVQNLSETANSGFNIPVPPKD